MRVSLVSVRVSIGKLGHLHDPLDVRVYDTRVLLRSFGDLDGQHDETQRLANVPPVDCEEDRMKVVSVA
jgi:hypothetical protein